MRRACLAILATLVVAACGGGEEQLVCPQVSTVVGLDRLNYTLASSSTPVRVYLDVVDVICEVQGDEMVVASAVAVRIAGDTPPGGAEVPYTAFVETGAGMSATSNASAIIPPGARGTIDYYDHRFPASVANGEVTARVIYALVPDAAELERLSRQVPRP